MDSVALQFEQALLAMDRLAAQRILSQKHADQEPIGCIEEIVTPVLERIGEQWEQGKVSLAQVYMSGRICEQLVNQFLPPAAPQRITSPKIAIAILDDYHTLGKAVVSSALRANGIEVKDFGSLDGSKLLHQVRNFDIDILLISVLMFSSALHIKDFIEKLKNEKLSTRVIVGGAPFHFDPLLWSEVGADAVGINTADAIRITRQLIEELT